MASGGIGGSNSGRECLHISLGPTANAVTSHLWNLQGLAATSGYCEPNVTHAAEKQTYVPRVMLVDEAHRFQRQASTGAVRRMPSAEDAVSAWGGAVATMDTNYTGMQQQPQQQQHTEWLDQLHQAATSLVQSPYSRYHAASDTANTLAMPTYSIASNNGRHVVWDDDDEEEEEEQEEEESETERRIRLQREATRFQQQQQSVEEDMRAAWFQQTPNYSTMGSSIGVHENEEHIIDRDVPTTAQTTETTVLEGTTNSSSSTTSSTTVPLSWMDFWMPPHPTRYGVSLPFSPTSEVAPSWDSFVMGSQSVVSDWREDELLEQLRHMLEDCDSVQGVTIATEGYGVHAGLTSLLLQELREECRTAGRFVLHVTDPMDRSHHRGVDNGSDDGWHTTHVKRVRRNMQSGLALHSFGTDANLVLPLCVGARSEHDVFRASSKLALALEAATLAYRVSGSNRNNSSSSHSSMSAIGLTGHYGGSGIARQGYSTASSLSFGEFLATVQPSQRYKFAELEVACPEEPAAPQQQVPPPPQQLLLQQLLQQQQPQDPQNDQDFVSRLEKGTSVERERLLRQSSRHSSVDRTELPGGWLDSEKLLSSLAPPSKGSRSMHHQFGTTMGLRFSVPPTTKRHKGTLSDAASTPTMSTLLTCLMESAVIPFRPKVSMGTVVGQSAAGLTDGGYGAGSYWQALSSLSSNVTHRNKNHKPLSTVLSVLGTSSRSYDYLNGVATGFKESLSFKYRGYHSRDVLNGILPEAEDCDEAREYCFGVRETYHPPEGTGLGVDEEGTYFDQD